MRFWEWLTVLLLVFATVRSQEEESTDTEQETGDVEDKSGDDGDEEAWKYVEFLKAEVK